MPHTESALSPSDWAQLFHTWQEIVEDERHPLYTEACRIAAAANRPSFSPGALFCELVGAN